MSFVSLQRGVTFPVVYYVEFSNCLKKKKQQQAIPSLFQACYVLST